MQVAAIKNSLIFIFILGLFCYYLVSCQKELSADPIAGTLDTGLVQNCLPVNVNGTYILNGLLSDANYIEASVSITSPGNFYVYTDTLNGFFFNATGKFSTPGTYTVVLKGNGKPVSTGIFDFTLFFLSSSCKTTVVVSTDTVSSSAVFTLVGSPLDCFQANISGSFIKDLPLANSTIGISVDITKPGSYHISTNTVNGYRFESTGLLNVTGRQTIVLTATGTPLQTGSNSFNITGLATTCFFTTEVLENPLSTNSDYFPLTQGSFWNYDDLFHLGDTIKRSIAGSVQLGGSTYQKMVEQGQNGPAEAYFFRKTDDDYFEYTSVDKYTSVVKFVPAVNAPINFLKEKISSGTIWKSAEYIGNDSATGKPVMLRYVFECVDADANIYINGITYRHLYNITMQVYTRPNAAVDYQAGREINGFFYAKGIGILYMKKTNRYYNRMEIKIRNWAVK